MRRLLPMAAALLAAATPGTAAADTVTASDIVVLEDRDGSLYAAAGGLMADGFLQKTACALYQARPEADPDVLFVVSSARLPLMSRVQSGIAVFRQVRGIGIGAVDKRALSCSTTRRLRHAVRMGDFDSLPDDPRAQLEDRKELSMPALAMMAHEMGHYWMAYPSYDPGDGMGQRCDLRIYTPVEGSTDTTCGGYPVSAFGLHWSALFESGGIMFGSPHIQDLGDGTFRFHGDGVFKFGPLDQYLMGLRMAEQVGPLTLIRTPSSAVQSGDYPLFPGEEKVVEGSRVDVDINDVIRFEGVRYPPLDPCHWKGLFVLVHPKGKPPAADRVQVLADYANAYQDFYAEATDLRGSMDLTLDRRGRGTAECPDPLAPPPPADDGPGDDGTGPADVPGPTDVPAEAVADVPAPGDEAPATDGTADDPGARDGAGEAATDPGGEAGTGACLPGALRCNPVGNGVAQRCADDGRTWTAVDDCGLAGKECRDGACVAGAKGGGCAAGTGNPGGAGDMSGAACAGAILVLALGGLATAARRRRRGSRRGGAARAAVARVLVPLSVLLALAACDSGSPVTDPGPADVPADVSADVPADAPADVPADAPADVPDTPPPPAPHPLFDFVGHVLLEEQPSPYGDYASLSARFTTGPDPHWHGLVAAEGPCELWVRRPEYPATCTPGCPSSNYCGADLQCHPWGQRVGAGTLTVDATGGPFTLAPDDTSWYVPTPEPGDDLFAPGMTVRVRSTGRDVPAFDISLPGLADLDADVPSPIVLEDDVDEVLAWPPAGDGGEVEAVFQTGHHIPPPTTILYCRVPESAGRLVIPKALIAGVAPMGGIGLFPHPSFLRKVRRHVLDTAWGPVEVALATRQGVAIEHGAR